MWSDFQHVLKNQKVDKACEKFIILRYVSWPDMLSSFVVKVWSPRLVYNKFLLQGSSTNSTACAGGIQMWLLCDLPGGGAGKLMKIGGYFRWHVLIFGKLEAIFHWPVLIYVHGPLNFEAKNSDETQSKPQRSRVAPKGLLDQNGWAWKNRLSKSGKRVIYHIPWLNIYVDLTFAKTHNFLVPWWYDNMIVCWKCSLLGDGRCESHQSWLRSQWKRVRMWEYCHAGMSAPRLDGRNPNQSVTTTSQWNPQLMALLGEVASTCRKESNSGYVPKKENMPACWQVLKALFASYLFHPVPNHQSNLCFRFTRKLQCPECEAEKHPSTTCTEKNSCWVEVWVFPEVSFPETWFCWPKWPGPNCGVFFYAVGYPTRKTLEFGTMFWDTGKSQRCGNLTGTTLNASHSGSKRATPAVSGSPNCCNKRNMKHDLQTYSSIINIPKIVHKRLCLKALESRISHFLNKW